MSSATSDDIPLHANIKRRKINRVSTVNREHEEREVSNIPRTLCVKSQEQCGLITKIVLRNVFCHEYLDFDGFTASINLLQGANGSGKSSIVAAIVAGLGGSSKATDRGQNLTSLIQHGKQWASIEIHLKNEGCNTYKDETFGKTIIVERKLLISGSSSYKIKSEKGTIISTKKDDLNKILNRFNFQVDNPVLILSQERAKTFLSTTDPKTLFKFFMTSTQMKQWSDSIGDVSRDIETSNTLVVRKKENLLHLEKELKTWREKFQAINSLEEKRDRVSLLTRAKMWAEVEEEEQELKKCRKEQQKIDTQLNQIVQILENIKTKKGELANKDRISNERLITLAEMTKDLEIKRRNAKSELDEVNTMLRRKVHERKDLEKEKMEKERDVSALREKLEKDNNEATSQWEATISILKLEEKKVEQHVSEIEERMQTEDSQIRNVLGTIQEVEKEYHHLNLEQKALEERLKRLQKELHGIQEQTDNITVFGQFMPHVIKEINTTSTRGQFKYKPIGPIGSYIKVRNNLWIHVVEKVARGLLSSFLVSCRQDFDALNKIFNRTIPHGAPRPQVIVTPFRDKVHDFGRFETGTDQYFSMWSIIETDNVQVANALLDQLQVESYLLINTAEDAMDLLQDENTVPQNCKKAMTLHGDTIFPAPDYRIYSGNGDKSVKFLQVSVEDKIRDLQLNITSTTQEVQRSRGEILEKKENLQVLQQEKIKSAEKIRACQRSLSECKKKLQDLKNREIPPPPDVNELQKDLEENENRKKEIEEKLNEVSNQFLEGKKGKEKSEQKFKEAQSESERIRIEAQKYESDASQTQEKLLKNKKELIGYTNKEKEMREKVDSILKIIEEKESVVDRKISELTADEKTSERISVNKSKNEIEKELIALKAVIEEREASYGSLAFVAETLEEKNRKYKNICSELKSQNEFIVVMRNCLNSRLTLIKQAKKLYQLLLRSTFASMIQRRNLKGALDIDYKAETLKILMTKDTGRSANDTMQSLQMMSGGERSFATVSFILALWDIITSPIRIMDEFDIFMDVVSRKQCMDMIVEAVKNECQYIMVSPLEYRGFSDKVNVFRMEAPKRKQIEERRRTNDN